ncbi:MAG: hypothetical protein EON54_03820 [Alcaligenaceae bacterium]|nr:MAG: hypothetical protein EON54_03820 [Alcaligenaceae bacterium]
MSAQDVKEFLDTADKPGALKRYMRLNPFDRGQIAREVAHWERVREGHRAHPDLLPIFNSTQPTATGPATGTGLAMPFSGPDTHHPSLSSTQIAHGDRVFDRIAQETMAAALQSRMGTDLDKPVDPPTLRDQVEAAFTAHNPADS